MKRLNDNSDVPEARLGILQKTKNKLKEKDKGYILLAFGRMGTPGWLNKRAGRKRVCGRFWSKYAYGQQERDLISAELETMRISRTTVMTTNGMRAAAKPKGLPISGTFL